MNLNFPSRFLKKLEIYQQIRSGQGISKHKHLWKYEAGYLQAAYGKDHQHLLSYQNKNDLKIWITKFAGDPGAELDHTIGNLFWREFIEVRNDNGLLNRSTFDGDSKLLANKNNPGFRVSPKGLIVGEVLTEINHPNLLIRFWNNYKYSLVLDTIWLLLFFSLGSLILNIDYAKLHSFKYRYCCISFSYNIIATIFLLFIWPFLSFLFRKIYLYLEKQK